MPESAILLSLGIPLAGAVLIALFGRQPNLREGVTLTTAALLFGTVITLVPEIMAGGRPEATLIEMLPGLPLRFEVEPLGMLFALVASANKAARGSSCAGGGRAAQTRRIRQSA